MLTCMMALPCYSANNAQWWKQYAKQALGLSIGGAVGAALAPRWQQNRYFGALCGAGLWLSSAYLLSRLYKQYRYRGMHIEKIPNLTTPQEPRAQLEQGDSHQKSTSSSSPEQNLNIAPQQEVKEQPYAKSEPEQPHVITKAEADAYKPTMEHMIVRKNQQAITDFQKYGYAPNEALDKDGNTALYLAIIFYNHAFADWFIKQYDQNINHILMLNNKKKVSPLFSAIMRIKGWNHYGNKYPDVAQLFTDDPLYQRILHIIAHTNEFSSKEDQKEIAIARRNIEQTIGEERLNQLINELLAKEQTQANS